MTTSIIRGFGEGEWLVMDDSNEYLGNILLTTPKGYLAKRGKRFLGEYQSLDDAADALCAYNSGE